MIETERLILRPHRESDFDGLCAVWSDPEVVRFISGVPSTPDQSWSRLLRAAGTWAFKGYGPFAIIDKQTGCFLGDAGHGDFRRDLGPAFDPFPEAGWVMAGEAHGRGLGTEAVMAVHRWFDEHRPETRSVCIINPENVGSMRVAEKVGYRPFGTATYHEAEVVMLERLNPISQAQGLERRP